MRFKPSVVLSVCTWFMLQATAIQSIVSVDDRDDIAGEPSPAQQELIELATQFDELRDAYWKANREAETDSERLASLELNPDDEFVPKFLELEERHRGTDVGLFVLHFLVREGARYGDPDASPSQARVTACERLIEHYSDHPDVDICLGRFSGGVWIPEAEMLMRHMAEHGAQEHVRAAAWYNLAKWLNKKSELPRIQKKISDRLETASEEQKVWQLRLLDALDAFGEIDSDQVKQEAIVAAEHVVEHFADVRPPVRQWSGPARILFTRDDTLPPQDTYGERAGQLLFELEHLSIGSPAPEIAGKDADGELFDLSDYRGRVVVLMFSANWCGPCKGMYPDNRKLVETLADEPFAFLGVMVDEHIDTVHQAYDEREITWRVWWDGADGPIAKQWNINSWPTIYVIDHRGIICDRQLRGEELANAVTRVLKARADDPEADALLESHPLPSIPILERTE